MPGKVDNWERKLKIDNSGQARLVEISLVQYQYLLGESFVLRTRAWPLKSDGPRDPTIALPLTVYRLKHIISMHLKNRDHI